MVFISSLKGLLGCILCLYVSAHMYVYVPHACLVPMEARKGMGLPGTEVTCGC